tara:strand:+ start:400 stop:921 length:522 start_codon:yes stop_codon:yes gene_type:complete
MEISKEIQKRCLVEFVFVEGFIEIDSDYFIKKIQEGCQKPDNLNAKTNVGGIMTSFQYFVKDEKFINIITQFIDHVDANYSFQKYRLTEAWGFAVGHRQKTKNHNHQGNVISGVLYLNEHHQTLDFPEINQSVKPEKGKFALFSSHLHHGCEINKINKDKWGLSFNMGEVKDW